MTKSPYGYDLLAPDGSDFVNIPELWNTGVSITESFFDKMGQDFAGLSVQPGNRTTDTLSTSDNLDTWTSVITDASGHEVARKVDVESRNGNFAVWTSTITIGDKVVTIVDTETANGWTREVR